MLTPKPGSGLAILGQYGPWLSANCTFRLYRTPLDPADVTDVSQVEESAFPGYAPLAAPAWSLPSTSPGGIPVITHPPLTWTASGSSSESVYGYYVTGPDGELLWLEPTSFPVPMGTAGFTHIVYPQYTMDAP